MKKFIFFLCVLPFIFGCRGEEDIYPKRPKDAPYYYNESSMTEMDPDAKITLRRARAETGIEFVTVILKKLPANISVGEYSAGLFDKWRIGSRTGGKGVLLLFVEDTHTLKIEVSYELEGVLTDAFCSSFQPTIKSYFAGRYFGDVFSGLVTCITRRVLVGPEAESEGMLREVCSDPEILKSSEIFLSGGGGIIDDEYFYEKDVKLSFITDISHSKLREFETDKDIEVVLERYFKSLREGINYPFLGILTEGSQMHRLEYPESADFYKSRWEDCRAAFPYKIKYSGNLAALRFGKQQSTPVFLRRSRDGYWKIDATRAWVSSWQDFANNRSGPLHRDHPWMFAFSEYGHKKSLCNVPGLLNGSLSVRGEISRLEEAIKNEPVNASNYFQLADIFYWDCLWIRAAIDLVEKGLELEPENVPYRWLAVMMNYRFPCSKPNSAHLEKLLEINPEDLDALEHYSRHQWYYTMDHSKAMQVLRMGMKVEKELTGRRKRFIELYFNFMHYYWTQVGVDKNLLWRVAYYLYIFHLPHITYLVLGGAIVGFGIFAFPGRRRKTRAKIPVEGTANCSLA